MPKVLKLFIIFEYNKLSKERLDKLTKYYKCEIIAIDQDSIVLRKIGLY